jgi:Tfp pilus assembly protein PilN
MSSFGFGDFPQWARGRGSYADPHATIAIRDIPTNIKLVQRLTRFYYNQDALLGAVVDKMSEYPITQLVIGKVGEEEITPSARDKWESLLNVTLNLRQTMIDINVDKYVFGNSFHYLYYPFVRYCLCRGCRKRSPIGTLMDVRAIPDDRGGKFTFEVEGVCPKCNAKNGFTVEDRKSEARSGLNFVRLSPLRMELEYNPVTGHRRWYWDPDKRVKDGLISGDRTIIDYTEMRVLEAAFKQQKIHMNKDRLWVAQAPVQPGIWQGWGVPPLFRVLEDVYYYKVLRRANEALAQEHVVPMRVVSPAGTGDVSPQRTMNLSDWRNRLKDEFLSWKKDPNHMMISPIPINVEQIGGQGRVMMVAAEMEAAARVIAAGVGCPVEMIWGGLNWSGASVSLRVLENHFINDRENCERLLGFLIPKIASYFRMPRIQCKLSEFRMADDVQQQANLINLMTQGFLSRESVIGEMGFDPGEEFTHLAAEHKKLNSITMSDNVAASHMNTVIQMLEAKAQILMQHELAITQAELQAQGERDRLQTLKNHVDALHEKGYATPLEFDQSATLLSRIDPNLSQLILSNWQATMPNTVLLLTAKMQQNQANLAGQQQAMQAAGASNPNGGAAEGETMATGAEGPYSEEGDDGGPANSTLGGSASEQTGQSSGGEPQQRPPTRQAGTPGAQ